jgi:hypothetical protein
MRRTHPVALSSVERTASPLYPSSRNLSRPIRAGAIRMYRVWQCMSLLPVHDHLHIEACVNAAYQVAVTAEQWGNDLFQVFPRLFGGAAGE